MQLGIDCFRGQKHQRAIRRLAIQDVAVGNGADMGAHGKTHAPCRFGQRCRGFGATQRLIGLERKLRIDHDGAGRVGQVDQAVRPPPVGKRGLHRIGIGRQRLADQIIQLDFPEGPARLLVGQDILQGQHIARQLFDIGLRLVDGFQPLVQFAQ